MPPRLSRHALDEARRRQIPLDILEAVIAGPEQMISLGAVLAVYQSRVTNDAGKV